jgi:hypothetical protein
MYDCSIEIYNTSKPITNLEEITGAGSVELATSGIGCGYFISFSIVSVVVIAHSDVTCNPI